VCVHFYGNVCLDGNSDTGRNVHVKLSEGGNRSREQWTMKTALFRMAFCCCELCGRDAKEASKARL